MKVIPCTMILNATSAEHLAAIICRDVSVYRQWLIDRLAREDDDSDLLASEFAWMHGEYYSSVVINSRDIISLRFRLKTMLLRDCQERIAEYLS